jgi:hypothetical protein
MLKGCKGGVCPTKLEAGNGHVPLSTDVPNHKTAYCTLLGINTIDNNSNIKNKEQRLIYTDNFEFIIIIYIADDVNS